jgi:predicted negative regulator of RcsB-dependent stress response
MTKSEYDTLRTQLAQNTPADLAELIAELATSESAVYEAATAFVQRKDPKKLVKTLRAQLRKMRTGKTFYTYRIAGEFQDKLWGFLNSIDRNLRPEAPLAALDLLGVFFEADSQISERADDSNGMIGDAYRHAAELFAQISESLQYPAEAAIWFDRLLENNDYGLRDHLLDNANRILTPVALEARIQKLRTQLEALPPEKANRYDHAHHDLEVELIQLVKASKNVELYAEIKLQGRPAQQHPAYAIDIAKLYLDNGNAEKALEYLPEFNDSDWNASATKLRIQALEALGDIKGANHLRLKSLADTPSVTRAEQYLESLPPSERDAAKANLCLLIKQGDYKPSTQAEVLIALDEATSAAEIICNNAAIVQDESYYTQSELANALAPNAPLAATLLYRGAAEKTLEEAKPKNYRYAVAYLTKLIKLNNLIQDWNGHETHETWWPKLHAQHDRKTSLTRELKKAGIA